MIKPVLSILAIFWFAAASGQQMQAPPLVTGPSIFGTRSGSLPIDMNRLDLHHSYSISWLSGGGRSLSGGEYTGTVFYRFESPVLFRMDVGVMHDPFGTQTFGPNNQSAQVYLKNLSFDWKPSENTLFRFAFSQVPSVGYTGYYPSSGWSRMGGFYNRFDPWASY